MRSRRIAIATMLVLGLPAATASGAERLDPEIDGFFTSFDRYTRVDILRARKVPAGATVEVRCNGRGCPFAKRRFPVRGGVAKATRPFKGAKLRKGVVLEVWVARRGAIGEAAIWRIDNKRVPRKMTRCLPPGAATPTTC